MSTRNEILEQLETARDTLDAAQKALDAFEPDDDEAHEHYDETLRETYGDVDVCGVSMDALDVLKHMDPIAYRTGFNDWIDGADAESFAGYEELQDALEEAQDEVARLEELAEISDEEAKP